MLTYQNIKEKEEKVFKEDKSLIQAYVWDITPPSLKWGLHFKGIFVLKDRI